MTPRRIRLLNKTRQDMNLEATTQIREIKTHPAWVPELTPFIRALEKSLSPLEFMEKAGRPAVFTLCTQAPMELFHGAGVVPVKLACGLHSAGNTAPSQLPALTCPMIRSMAGILGMEEKAGLEGTGWVIPTTCDWVTRFSELAGLPESADILFMDLPRLKEDEKASRRWLKEIIGLKQWLETLSGRTITPKVLFHSMSVHLKAWQIFCRLTDLRRSKNLPARHFALMANGLPYMDIEKWMGHAQAYLAKAEMEKTHSPRVLVTGSPIVFPNYKLLTLIENAGIHIAADDICTLENVIPGGAVFEDRSEYGLVRALAERNHKGCTCPVFADGHRRINAMVNTLETHGIRGVIFHVLKGCHPYDMTAGLMEADLKAKGIQFMKIETDYVKEDEQNIVTRLEAFGRTLAAGEKKRKMQQGSSGHHH